MVNTNKIALLTASLAGVGAANAYAQHIEHPNIVIIITDQQQASKMSYLGTEGLSTPTMDRIASTGVTFTNAYSTFPLSVPERCAMFTGMYPSSFNLRGNPGKDDRAEVDYDKMREESSLMMANLFNEAGYDTYYSGKEHLISDTTNNDCRFYGFREYLSQERRGGLGPDVARFLATKSPEDNPFLLVVSYINPHDICEYDDYVWIDKLTPKVIQRKWDGISRVERYVGQASEYDLRDFYATICPQVPTNHAPMIGEPSGLPGRVVPYSEEQWQMHRYVYNRLVEEVDSDIAPVMDALDKGGFLGNTVVVFMSDHGEMDGAHCREHKNVPYGECQVVPFAISGPGIRKGVVDHRTVVNTGVDLLPTVCEFAGIDYPEESYPGLSVKGIATGERRSLNRKYIYTEGPNWYQVVEDGRYKYTIVETEGPNEILVDLKNDPGETTNLALSSKYNELRQRLSEVLAESLRDRGLVLAENKKVNDGNQD